MIRSLLKVIISSHTRLKWNLIENCGILFNNLDPEGLGYVIKDILYGKYDLKFFAENLYNEIHSSYNLDKMLRGLKELYLQFSKVNAN